MLTKRLTQGLKTQAVHKGQNFENSKMHRFCNLKKKRKKSWIVQFISKIIRTTLFFLTKFLRSRQSWQRLVFSTAKADERPYENSLSGERGQSSAVPQRTACSPGEHGIPWHCWWQPPSHTGPHLDHHSALPGQLTMVVSPIGWCVSHQFTHRCVVVKTE